MKKINIVKKIVFILLLTISVFSFHKTINVNNFDNYIEIIKKVESEEEAYLLASKYDLTLLDISPYNIGKYKINTNNYNEIIDKGFYVNKSLINAYTPTDPYYQYQDELIDTNINQVWNYTLGDGVVVAIIDTGIIASNLEFENSISPLSYNSVTRIVGINAVTDDDGHGTSVASILSANHNNGNGLAGVAPNAEIMIIKANKINEEGESRFSESDLVDAIYYAVDNGADIINMSLGGEGYNQLMQDAVNYAYDNQVIIVAAAGNDGDNSVIYPAAYNNVISVAATDEFREVADFSVYNEFVDISAPGVDIVNITMDNNAVIGNGTSFAAPIISGVLALYKSGYPDDDIEKLINKLYSSAIDISIPGKDIYSGHGYLDAYSGYIYDLYKVSFLNYDDSILKEQYVTAGDSATYNVIPVKEEDEGFCYEFVGWDTDFSVVNKDLIIKPIFNAIIKKYTYSFFDDNNTIIKQELANYETVITAPNDPVKESSEMYDYTFLGWDPIFIEGSLLRTDVNYHAVYSGVLREFTVSYYDFFDVLVKEERVIYGEPVNGFMLDNYQDEQFDYIFSYWDSELSNITSDLIVKPIFVKQLRKFSVDYFDYFGEFIKSEEVEYGLSPLSFVIETIFDDVYKYEFISWDQDLSYIINDLAVYPLYSQEYKKYTVNFYDYFGELNKSEQVIYSKNAIEHVLDLDYDEEFEYHFIDWKQDFTNVTKDLEIYPLFGKIKRKYNISFAMNDNVITRELVFGEQPIIDFDTSFTGYDFLGWDREIIFVSGETTYTAIYRIKTYRVRFLDGDDLLDEIIINYNESIYSLPQIPVKEGYNSEYEEVNLINIKEDLTINVIHNPKSYLIVIKLEDNDIERQTMNYGDFLEEYPAIQEKKGYDVVYPETLPLEIKENLVLDIKYERKIYKVTYLDKLGLVFRSDNVLYGEIVEEYNMDDDKFSGWYLDEKLFDFNTPIFEDIILKPKYKSRGCLSGLSYTWFSIFALVFFIIRKRKI